MKEEIKFIRQKDFKYIKPLGQGGCGTTVLLMDEILDEHFVCKKYQPYDDTLSDDENKLLFDYFVNEIKILHKLYHENIVRVFNYYLYLEERAGYIIMEYIEGNTLQDYLNKHPEEINNVFIQTINGFKYLEENEILHRDIRPANIMVEDSGTVKIIDFGFGKTVDSKTDFMRSITLNIWCQAPDEFKDKQYTFATEVYFVGKLFEMIIRDEDIKEFKFSELLSQMIVKDPTLRQGSFQHIANEIFKEEYVEIVDFSDNELSYYRNISKVLNDGIGRLETSCEIIADIDQLQHNISNLFKKVMLEEWVPSLLLVGNCFLNGNFYYDDEQFAMSVHDLQAFIRLIRSSSKEKVRIIFINLMTVLEAKERFTPSVPFNDDLPF